MGAPHNDLRSTFASTTGGVMTDEAGAVTGDLEVSTGLTDGDLGVLIRYVGAEEWYTVSGSPIPLDETGRSSPKNLHERVVKHLTTPGPVVDGNEEPTSLRELFAA